MPTDVTQAPTSITNTGTTSKYTGTSSATATLAAATTASQDVTAGYDSRIGTRATGTISLGVPFLTLGSGEVADSLWVVADSSYVSYHISRPSGSAGYVAKQGGTTYFSKTMSTNTFPSGSIANSLGSAYAAPGLSGTGWASAATCEFSVTDGDFGFTFSNISFRWRKYAKPTISSLGPTGSITTTARPTITWTFAGDGLAQNRFQVKIFTAAQYGIGGFDPETSPNTVDSGVQVSTSNSWTCTVNLPNSTTYRAYVKCAQLTPGSSIVHWTTAGTTWAALGAAAYTGFSTNYTGPSAVTSHTPAAASTQNTSVPTLTAVFPAHTIGAAVTQQVEWQFATDAGFTTNARTVLSPNTFSGASGSNDTYAMINSATRLFQGTWYMRARMKDSNGLYGSYDTATSFTVSHPPTAGSLTPTGAVSRDYGGSGSTTVGWAFSDTYVLDAQSAYQVLVERDSDSLSILDTGKQTSAVQSHTWNISATYKDTLLRWRVRLWDSDDVVGTAYTANQQFYVRDLATVAITDPVGAGSVNSPQPTFTWTFSASGGRTQTHYRLQTVVTSGGAAVWDSGYVASSALSAQHVGILTNGVGYTSTLTLRDSSGLEKSVTVAYTASWTPADNPTVTISVANYTASGYVGLSWPQNRDANFVSYNVWRRVTGTTTWYLVATITDVAPSTYTYNDYFSQVGGIDYAVTQSALRFGVSVESAKNVQAVTTVSDDYWLILNSASPTAVKLPLVKNDSFTDEWEQAEITLLGRGRRIERGTHYGYKGSLTCQVYDTATTTARQTRQALEAAKAAGVAMRLRNPFGDVWDVAVGDLSISRIAGVGQNEYFTVDVPYTQILTNYTTS
jgi:hypothetical protein